jgi:amino acid adenylation domain-containing protein
LTGVYFNLNPKVQLDGFSPLRARMQEGRKPGLLGELMFNFYEEDDALALDLHHSTEFFSEQRIAAILAELEQDLAQLVAKQAPDDVVATPAPTRSPQPVDATTPSGMPDRGTPLDRAPRVEQWIAAQAARSPERIALVSGDQRWSYAQLERFSNQIASALRSRGVQPGDWVGLCLPRGPQLVGALLGVLKCGAAYVPLDPAFPLERLRDMAEDAGLRLLLCDAGNAARLQIEHLDTLQLDRDQEEIERASTAPLAIAISEDAPAYVIYTSGSTGKPKGVVVLQRGVANFLRSMAHTPGMRAGDRILAVTTLSFDIAVLELLLPLCVGAEIVLAQRTDVIDGAALSKLINVHRVSLMQATPSTWHLLLEAGFQAPTGFRALCGGEALSPALAARLLKAQVAELWNMYGPTETTVWSTVSRVTDPDRIDVGRPIDDTVVRLLDEQGRECDSGEPGEICIGGGGVAQGYHARPELTADRFIADPFDSRPGARLYRTGDLGAWNSDGTIRHMGRLDHQIKLRGYRIELGEIEARLEQVAEIARAAMKVESFGEMDDRLVAYAVAAAGASMPTLAAIRRELGQHLPDYMLPQVLRELPELPLLPNGKIDRKALAAPPAGGAITAAVTLEQTQAAAAQAAEAIPAVADASEGAAAIAEEMGRLLKQDTLGIDAHFFEQGGHSLLAAELASAVQRRLGTRPSLRAIFESPTPRQLATTLLGAQPVSAPALPALVRRADRDRAPLSVQQLRAWFIEQTSSHASVNLLPSAHRLSGPFDADAFQRAFSALIARQSALRCVFHPSVDGVEQRVLSEVPIRLPLTDLSGLPGGEAERRVYDAVAALQAEPMDLSKGPPLRAALFRLSAEQHVFVFVVHHLVWDGWSFDLLYQEMAALYASEVSAAPAPQPLALEYADYCAWQRELLASGALRPQIEHWRAALLPAPAPLDLPLDHPRPAEASGRGGSVRLVLPADALESLHRVAREQRTTLFVVLLTAYTAMLQRLTGQDDLIVGTPVRGREHADLLPVMGFFVNALPLRFRGRPSDPGSAVDAVKKVVADALGHPDVPIEALVRELKLPRDASRPALFQTMFSFQDVRERPPSWGPLQHERVGVPVAGSSHELSLWCVETRGGLETIFTFAADLLDTQTVRRWGDGFQSLLRALGKQAASSSWDSLLSPFAPSVTTRSLFPDTVPEPPSPASETLPSLERSVDLLRSIWRDLLAVETIADDDNFFELGGHSLLALTMVGRVELASGKRLSLLRVGDSSLRALASELATEDSPSLSAVPSQAEAEAAVAGPSSRRSWTQKLFGRE